MWWWQLVLILQSLGFLFSSEIIANTTCRVTAKYQCTSQHSIVIWDIRVRGRQVFSPFYTSVNEVGQNYTQTHEAIHMYSELLGKNSSHLYSAVIITYNGINAGINVQCDEIDKIPFETNIDELNPPTAVVLTWSVNNNLCIAWDSNINATCFDIEAIPDTVMLINERSFLQLSTVNITGVSSLMVNITSVCSGYTSFYIDSCYFNKTVRMILEQDYFYVSLNCTGYWELQYHNSNGTNDIVKDLCSILNNKTEPKYKSTNTTYEILLSSSTFTKTQLISYSEGTFGINRSLFLILLSTIIPGGIVLLTLIIFMAIVTSIILCKRRKQSIISEEKFVEDATYMPLNNRFYKNERNKISSDSNHNTIEITSADNYSALKHKKPIAFDKENYQTLQCNNSSNRRKGPAMEYAEIEICRQCGQTKTCCDEKVHYTSIGYPATVVDHKLDLNSLLLQLRPISHKFRLFGSVAGISPASLNTIVSECTSPYNALMEVCDLWLEKCRKEEIVPTWHAVAEILDLIGETELSKGLLEVYITGDLPEPMDINLVVPQVISSHVISKDIKSPSNINCNDETSDREEPPPIPPYIPEKQDNLNGDVVLSSEVSPTYEVISNV